MDGWDYAIGVGCGVFAMLLDYLCVRTPLKPTTTAWTKQVDGIFNRGTQTAFNKLFPKEFSERLKHAFTVGAADVSVTSNLVGAPHKALNPLNHRLRALSHDPILGIITGAVDMMQGKTTIISDGNIMRIASTKAPLDFNLFQSIGQMLGHFASDINAPSAKGNRGMGLPAPFMGLLKMFNDVPIGDSTFDKQVEYMYVNGYDFRQFIASTIPMLIMEILLRSLYIGKQVSLYKAPLGETIVDTIPTNMNPKFRIILTLAYGTAAAIDAGKVYLTKNIMRANYTAWMGFAWNSFFSLKWILHDRHHKLWDSVIDSEISNLNNLVSKVNTLDHEVENLPI